MFACSIRRELVSTTYAMCLTDAVLCTMESIASPYIAFKGTYGVMHDVIDDVTNDVIKIEY